MVFAEYSAQQVGGIQCVDESEPSAVAPGQLPDEDAVGEIDPALPRSVLFGSMNASFHHVNVTVPRALEAAAKHFYGVVMALEEVPKPEGSRGRGGAWYQLGDMQLHLSIEDGLGADCISKRHVCYTVNDLSQAEERFRSAGVEIIPDDLPTPGWSRFYVRDPGGNRLEIAQAHAKGNVG